MFDLVPKTRHIVMIWLHTGFHGDDQINKLRTMRNLFRSGLFKSETKRRKRNRPTQKEQKKKDKGRNCIMLNRKKKKEKKKNKPATEKKKKEL